MSIREHPEDRFLRNSIIPSANSQSFGSGNRSLIIYYGRKIQNQSIFLRAKVRDRVGLKIFDKCDLLRWYICCILVKHLSRPIISILKTSVQREGQNTLNFLKPDSIRVDVFFGSAFAVDLAEVTKLFFEILLETSFFHLISGVSTNSILFLTYFL